MAGELPENFQEKLKGSLNRCNVLTFEKVSSTPIQKFPLDFPGMENKEVTVFEVICEYPITSPEISSYVKEIGIDENCYRVRGSGEPTEVDQVLMDSENNDPFAESQIKSKDYFGDDFNKGFLKDLAKAAKERKKDGVQTEYKLPKAKQDKAGAKSAMGS